MARNLTRSVFGMLRTSMRSHHITSRNLADNRFQKDSDKMYDDDPTHASGQTVVQILNKEQDAIFVDAFSSVGFKLNSGMRVMGPCAFFPRSVLHWNVKNVSEINEDSLTLFTVLEPKIDILIVGVGERENVSRINPNIMRYLKSKKINVEILPTDQALATYNFLNAEKRYVAGAFIPPSYLDMGLEDNLNPNMYGEHGDYAMETDYDHIESDDFKVTEETIEAGKRALTDRLHRGLGMTVRKKDNKYLS